jgi:hypothetical protein
VPYFGVVGIDRAWAYRLMPWIDTMDVSNMADPTIVPLIPQPNHPAYVSNAAIIASAAAELVGSMFPQEAAQWRYLGEEAGLSRICSRSGRGRQVFAEQHFWEFA